MNAVNERCKIGPSVVVVAPAPRSEYGAHPHAPRRWHDLRPATAAAGLGLAHSARMERVLLIDDSQTVLEMVSAYLEDAGLLVSTAESGEQGLAVIGAVQPDIVVCDMQMPGMSGIEVVKAVRERQPTLPVLMFTDVTDVRNVVLSMRHGAFGYLLKGLPEEQLVREIRLALEQRQLVLRAARLEEENLRHREHLEALVEEKTAELLMLQRKEAHHEKLASLGTLLAGVAHEMNNPLAAIASNLGYLRELFDELAAERVAAAQAVDPRLAEGAAVVTETQSCARRLTTLVSALKRTSRATDDDATCALSAVLIDVQPLVATQLRGDASLALPTSVEPLLVKLAHEELVSVLVNLLSNAIDALPPTGGLVEVRVRADGGSVHVEVRDNGCGIPAELLPRVFDYFFTTKAPGKGTGLGLSMVDRIVRGAGGQVQVVSEVGRGTTFTLTLPCVAGAEPADAGAGPR